MPDDLPQRPEADDVRHSEAVIAAETYLPADSITPELDRERGERPTLSEVPPIVTALAPPVPRPGFGLAVLCCLLFLVLTQVFPTLVIGTILMVVELASNGVDVLSSAELQQRLQVKTVLPALLASQLIGVLLSCLGLWLLAGRDWARQIGLRRPGLWHVLIAVLGFPSLPILASGAYQIAKDSIPGIRELPAFLVTQAVVLLVVWLILRLSFGKNWGAELRAQAPAAQLGLVTAGLAIVLTVGLAVYQALALVLPIIPYDGPPLMEAMVKQFRDWPWWLAVLAVGVGPGLNEELWCRGFLGRGLVGRYGIVLGVVLTSYLFGLIHGEPHQGTMAVLMGLALHFSYLMTRSLWVPILLHFLSNSLSVLASSLGDEFEKIDSRPDEIPGLVYAAAGLLMLAAGWAFYRSRARLVSRQEGLPPWEPPFPGVAHPPPESDTVVVRPWPGWLPTLALAAAAAIFAVVFYLAAVERLPG